MTRSYSIIDTWKILGVKGIHKRKSYNRLVTRVSSGLLPTSRRAAAPHNRVGQRGRQHGLCELRKSLAPLDVLVGVRGVVQGDAAKVAVAEVGLDDVLGLVLVEVVAGVVDGVLAPGQANVQLRGRAGSRGHGGRPRVVGEAAAVGGPRAGDVVRVGRDPRPGGAGGRVVELDEESVKGDRRYQLAHAGVWHGALGRGGECQARLGGRGEQLAELGGEGDVSSRPVCAFTFHQPICILKYACSICIRRVLLTVGRVFNVQREPVDCRSGSVTIHVERPGQTRLDPDLVPGPKETEKHVCKLHAIRDAVELVFTRVTSKGQEYALSVGPLACRYVGRELGTAGLQRVRG